MFAKFVSIIMSAVMAATSFVSTAVTDIVDTVSEAIFGVPYTSQAVESDFFNDMSDSDVVNIDDERGFIKNMIAVFVDSDMKLAEKARLFSDCGGVLIGWCAPADLYVITCPASTYKIATEKCKKLEALSGVELAVPVMANKTEPDYTPTDPFGGIEDEAVVWEELNPDGNNWWLEAIEARCAWDYSDMFSKINIGILDSGFDTEHIDLAGKISFPDSKQARRNIPDLHGTHVSGIVAASHNGAGIAGICDNSNLICIDWTPGLLQFWSTDIAIFFGFSTLVKAGAKVINMSFGTSGSKTSNSSGFFESVFETAATSYMMASLLSKGYDFVVVQSAGNGDYYGDPVDARNNGHFCALTEKNIFTGSKKVSKRDILDRIIVAASADDKGMGQYMQSEFSNVGPNVSVAAPGSSVYSCAVDGFEILSGTSMAAPVVTGVASLVWSVNPSFKGNEVKDIVCTATDDVAIINNETEYYYDVELMDYPMVNAKLAVEEALRRTNPSFGTVTGRIIGNSDRVVFGGVSHTVYSDGTYSFVAPESNGIAEVYDKYGNLIGSFDLSVVAGETTIAEDYNIENK